MLDILQVYTGCPSTGLQHLVLPRETLLIYPSLDSIIILNAHTLAFVRALAFWEAFPGALHANEAIQSLSVDPGMKLIIASMGARLATWAMSGVQSDTWRVHSSLLMPGGQPISTIDCKSGLLAVSTPSSLSIYTLILENDLPTWSPKWTLPIARLSRVRFSPSLMYIASTSTHDNSVRIYHTTSGKQSQHICHPRLVTDMNWRQSQSSRDDFILYTITSDATLRIFLPVLDAPQHVQLHTALDIFSAVPFSVASKVDESRMFWLNREVISHALSQAISSLDPTDEDARSRRVREIKSESWDLFLRVLKDGSLIVQAVANVDRRPPTLLRQLTLLQSGPSALLCSPDHLYCLPNPANPETVILVTSPPLSSFLLEPLAFFDARPEGLQVLAQGEEIQTPSILENSRVQHSIVRFVRTPNGEEFGALKADGVVEIWNVDTGGGIKLRTRLEAEDMKMVDQLVILEGGDYFATYSKLTQSVALHSSERSWLSSVSIPNLESLFSLPAANVVLPTIIGITSTFLILTLQVSSASLSFPPEIVLLSQSFLPLPSPPKMIIAVDPMGWTDTYGNATESTERDVLLSVAEDGEIAFWRPESSLGATAWKCTGKVNTGRKGISMAACSSVKKSVLVVPGNEGQEITVWDSKASQFASGLEYSRVYSSSDPVQDLDWTATPDNQSILAVGFAHRVELLCQQRMTYFDETPGWGVCWSVDLSSTIPHPISDSIWLKGGSLLIGAGHLMSLYSQNVPCLQKDQGESLFEHVARHNGPLDEYNPQMILQCLLWGKVELVKVIIVNLARNLEQTTDIHCWKRTPVEEYLKRDDVAKAQHIAYNTKHSQLFDVSELTEDGEKEQFSRPLVMHLMTRLEEEPIPHLTPNEQQSLLVLIQTTLEIEEQRRSLDSNGLRYLISMRVFYIQNRRLSMPSTPASPGAVPMQIRRRERLRYRDMIWAFHSESQELLLSASIAACDGGKMCWPDARALGVFIWLHSVDTLKSHMEIIARNQFLSGDNRDPTQCSLFYFALGKFKLVQGLWRQAAWHKEQSMMIKFLNNDFSQARWRTAALKNAFALLSKRRFEYAAAFFLLGGSLKDAVNVCVRNLSDFQLAVAIARVVEHSDDGPVLRDILTNAVIPTAFKEGNRWLASWGFWLLHRRDLAVRILVTPLQDIANIWDNSITEIGGSLYDDPSLALLFSQLKLKTLQTAKGTSEISGRTEFMFVLQIARVFCRMGCHALALDLLRTWSFERPSTAVHDSPVIRPPPSPLGARFALEPAFRRQSSIMIDMDVSTAAPTRTASPSNNVAPPSEREVLTEEGDLVARKAGMGRLMKSAKQDVKVPEFDMSAFF